MTIEWARKELKIRRHEEIDAESDHSWESWALMKRRRSYRRKDMGYSRTKAMAWLELAELEIENAISKQMQSPVTDTHES